MSMCLICQKEADTCTCPLDDEGICKNCEGQGVIAYNPNLNPDSFQGISTTRCTRCNGTGIIEHEVPKMQTGQQALSFKEGETMSESELNQIISRLKGEAKKKDDEAMLCPQNEAWLYRVAEGLKEAGVIAVGLCEHLTEQEQAFFIAGFQEAIKFLMPNSATTNKENN